MSGRNNKKKKGEVNKNQPSIKDTLIARKQQQQKDEPHFLDLRIDIEEHLLEYNDTVHTNDYEISTLARVHFRTKSNINLVLDKFIEHCKYQNNSKSLLLNSMIHSVMNEKYRIHYPFNQFKFNSLQDEITARTLLMHPAIEGYPELEKVNEFYTRNRLKPCSVMMDINNPIHTDIMNFVEKKREKYGNEGIYHYQKIAFNTVIRRFYESKGMVEYFDLQTITLEEMCMISNFKERAMKVDGIDNDNFEMYGQGLLNLYRQSPEVRFRDKKLIIKPRYYLLCNYITVEQEAIIITDFKAFYKKTNANDILRHCKEDFSKNLDPSLTREQAWKKIRERFFLHYLRQLKRNMPPFHELFFYDDEVDKDTNSEDIPQAVNNNQSLNTTPSKVTYRQRQVCAKNSDPEIVSNTATSSGSSTNEPTIIENVRIANEPTIIENVRIANVEMKFEDFLQMPEPSNSEMSLVVLLARSPNFLLPVREALKNQFKSGGDELWSEDRKRLTLIHYVLHFLRKNSEPFRKLIETSLGGDDKEKALKLFDDLVAYHNQVQEEQWAPPLITSTQIVDHSLQNEENQSNDDAQDRLVIIEEMEEEEVIFEQPKDFVLAANANVDPIQIKCEPLSQNAQNYQMDSEVQILSPEPSVIVLESDTDEDSMLATLEKDQNLIHDKYHMQLNAESQFSSESPTMPQVVILPSNLLQGESSESSQEEMQGSNEQPQVSNVEQPHASNQEQPQASNHDQQQATNQQKPQPSKSNKENQENSQTSDDSLSENNSLRQYELRVHQFAMEDRRDRRAKRKNKAPTSVPKKRTKRATTQKITFQSSDDTPKKSPPPGKALQKPLSIVNDENFSSSSEVAKSFTFNLPKSVDNGASCYLIEPERVTFKRDLIFEISIQLPQFSCYDVVIKDDDIQHVLNLNDIEWQSLKDNLNVVGEYEYIRGHSSNSKQQSGYGISIVRQLDLYFSTISLNKSFQTISNGHNFRAAPLSSVPSNLQTNAIDSDILKLMKK